MSKDKYNYCGFLFGAKRLKKDCKGCLSFKFDICKKPTEKGI